MNAQLKYADRRGSLCAVIQGSNERDAAGGPQVVIRDLALGAELAKANKDRADYLEMRARRRSPSPRPEFERVRASSRAARADARRRRSAPILPRQ